VLERPPIPTSRLWTPAHGPPLASYESTGDRLGEGIHMGKGEVIRGADTSSHSFNSQK